MIATKTVSLLAIGYNRIGQNVHAWQGIVVVEVVVLIVVVVVHVSSTYRAVHQVQDV